MSKDYLLLSIKGQWVKKILDGSKTCELRKTGFNWTVSKLLVYETIPTSALIAEAQIDSVTTLSIDVLWDFIEQGELAQVSRQQFDDYYKGKSRGTAIVISSVKAIKPIPLVKLKQVWHPWHPPQGFQYVTEAEYKSAIADI